MDYITGLMFKADGDGAGTHPVDGVSLDGETCRWNYEEPLSKGSAKEHEQTKMATRNYMMKMRGNLMRLLRFETEKDGKKYYDILTTLFFPEEDRHAIVEI